MKVTLLTWLIWFSILVRKLLKRASFISPDDLKNKILNFVDYFNKTMAKPFKWTYKGALPIGVNLTRNPCQNLILN